MFRLFKISVLICLFLLSVQSVPAQSLSGALSGKSNSASASTAVDHLGRNTPRSAIYQFLTACHEKKYKLASQYLDLRQLSAKERAQGPELAQELGALLDRNPRFQLSKLSDSAEGDQGDAMASNIDVLASFTTDAEVVSLNLERVQLAQDAMIWLVAPDSVAQIHDLSASIGESAIEEHLPAALVNTRILETPVWVWLALILLAVFISAVSRWLSKLLLMVLRPLTARYTKTFHTTRLEAVSEPLRLLLAVAVFRACLSFISPSALPRDLLLKLLTFLFVLGAASLFMRLVDIVSDNVIARLDPSQRAITYSIFPLGIRFVKILIFCVAALIVLQRWGYNTNTILAGLGVGGVAVALAAQKTIENLFGGISLISDRPVLVGDFCQFGGQVGTVEDIGLRSTRIRTLDRTLVTVPNSQFSTMTLENISKRDRMWFHPTIRLRRDTPPGKISQMMEAITEILKNNKMVDANGVPLRFSKITDQSLDLEIFAYVLTPDYNEYLKVQTQLLLSILEASYSLKIGLSVPFQEQFNVAVDPDKLDSLNPHLALQAKNGAE